MDCSTPGPCASPSPEVRLSSCVLHQWCHLILDTLFSICPQLFPASGTFLTSQLFASDDQNTGVLASTSNPSNEYSELISLKSDWLNLLAVEATLRSLLQHHSLKASILRCSTFFTVQLSQLYVNTGKTIDLTIRTESCLCFSTHCLGLSQLSCQEAVVFWFHGYSHHLQWF